jgi:chemotaxis family two-component system response regulator Rcp1
MTNKPIEILLVEDNPGDAELVREELRDSKLMNRLIVVQDGVAAMEYLRDSEKPKPDLMLLDINLPRKNGHEVLSEIRQDPVLELIPVIVLTTSDHDVDLHQAFENKATAYIQKPLGVEELIKFVQTIERFQL